MSGENDFVADVVGGLGKLIGFGAVAAGVAVYHTARGIGILSKGAYKGVKQEIESQRDKNKRYREFERQDRKKRNSQFNERLSPRGKSLDKQYRKEIDRVRNQYDAKLSKQAKAHGDELRVAKRDLSRELESVRESLEAQYRSLLDQISDLKSASERSHQAAREWAEDASRLLDHLDETYRHELFFPGELNRMMTKFKTTVEENLQNGANEAALSGAQSMFFDAQQLRIELECREAEWNALFDAATEGVVRVSAVCEHNMQSIKVEFGPEGDRSEEDIGGEYWTCGELGHLLKDVRELKARLEADKEVLTIDELNGILDTLEEFDAKNCALAEKAMSAFTASVYRSEMASAVAAKFQDKGWDCTEALYEQGDERTPLHMKLAMGDDQIVVKYSPEETDAAVRNSVNVAFFDESCNDETFRQERMNDILETMQEIGVDCSQVKCVPGTENQKCQDIGKLDFEQYRETT